MTTNNFFPVRKMAKGEKKEGIKVIHFRTWTNARIKASS